MIRSEKHSVVDAIERQMAHYAYHVYESYRYGRSPFSRRIG
nr:DUF1572 family protein [Halobacillus sp. Marseille-Q1614]